MTSAASSPPAAYWSGGFLTADMLEQQTGLLSFMDVERERWLQRLISKAFADPRDAASLSKRFAAHGEAGRLEEHESALAGGAASLMRNPEAPVFTQTTQVSYYYDDDEGLGPDDDVYAKLWKPTPEGRGLPLLVKHAFDPWSQAFLECENGFVNVGPEARALRGVDMRSFYDARGATLHAAVRYGPEAQGARSLVWILDLVHGGCIETVLHEALVEALKCTEDSEAIVVDFRCDIKVRYAGVLICFDKAARKISKTLRRTRFRNHRSL